LAPFFYEIFSPDPQSLARSFDNRNAFLGQGFRGCFAPTLSGYLHL